MEVPILCLKPVRMIVRGYNNILNDVIGYNIKNI